MSTKIDTVSARERLAPRREPYWRRIAVGCHIGYRVSTIGSDGAWIAKYRDPNTSLRHYKSLGTLAHLPPHERHDGASKAAAEWFAHLGLGGSKDTATVRDACELYAASLERNKDEKAAADVRRRFSQYVFNDPIARIDLAKLTAANVGKWRDTLQDTPTAKGKPRTMSTLNRDMVCLKAALNHAYAEQLVTTDAAWRSKLVPVKGADQRRDLYLDREQRQALIDAATPDLALFIRALCALPLRPGAMAGLTVADFDKRLNTFTVRTDKASKGRPIKLPETTAELFAEASKGKLPSAYLFTRWDGAQWIKDKWTCPTRTAAAAAGLPANATLYTLRHSVITDLVVAGVDLATVASISGTSVLMIQKHYHHLQQNAAAAALEKVAL